MRDYYEPKFLRGVITKIQPPRMFFRSRYFSDGITFPTKTVSFEFAADKRKLLPYAGIGEQSIALDREGYQLRTYTPPLSSGSRVITNDTLASKLIGESEYNSGLTAEERAARIAAQDLMDLQDALYRKEEYMCARLKQDGKLEIGDYGIVDYGADNIETVKSSEKWTATSDILGKLSRMARELRKHGTNPDTLIIGHDVSDVLSRNEAVLKLRNDQFVNIPAPDSLEDGVTFVCQLRAPGLYLNVYEYDEYYTDTKGKLVPLMDPDTVILQSSRERNMMLYGAVDYIDGKTREYVSAMGEYVPYVAVEEDPPMRKLILASRCLPMPRDMNSWLVLKSTV